MQCKPNQPDTGAQTRDRHITGWEKHTLAAPQRDDRDIAEHHPGHEECRGDGERERAHDEGCALAAQFGGIVISISSPGDTEISCVIG